ncbi:MAG: hypothetical protein COA73_06390 [Candidatus Hydrogenedentota bacterium]|nr:MAG: hypothetical protein COA73_06390 [Candidatus Hydrogenedentota bacterium]
MKHRSRGYILIEATVAMVILSMGAVTVHSVLRQGVLTRGQAQDYTSAQFVMDELIAKIELLPALETGTKEGVFDEYGGRFSYRYTIRKVNVPFPKPIPHPTQKNRIVGIPESKSFLVHVHADVFWSRGGVPFQASRETLYGPGRYFQPVEDE